MTAAASPDPSLCPLCGKANLCAMEVERETGLAQPPCWCMSAAFNEALLARIPVEARRKACVCAACAASTTPPLKPEDTHAHVPR